MNNLPGRYFSFLKPRAVIFGVAVFDLAWIWLSPPQWRFHGDVFVAVLLLVAAILLLIGKAWSNLLAAVLSGYFPLSLIWGFWMLAKHAEVPVFSSRHLSYFIGGLGEGGARVTLFLVLAAMILLCSGHAVIQSDPKQIIPNDV